MKKIAVVTDSNSGITQAQAQGLRVHVIPMPFTMDGDSYFEDINLTQAMFYKKLATGVDISTSQPSPGAVVELWDKLLLEYDEIIHIPMSSGLSASCESATAMARDYDGRVQVADNQRISVTQRQSALDAVTLADNGWDARRIKEYLEKTRADAGIYIMVDTLNYLKRGGRITPGAAAIGSILNIKPVLQLRGDKLDAYAKVRGVKHGRRTLLDAMRNDFEKRFAGNSSPDKMWLFAVYSNDSAAGLDFKHEVENAFPEHTVHSDPLSLSVACHIGPGALAIACCRKLDCL